MGLFDGINMAEQAMGVHRYRSEIAAQNIANVFTEGYAYKTVDLREGRFRAQLGNARHGLGGPRGGALDSAGGAIRVVGVSERATSIDDYRSNAMLGAVEMMRSKNAFEMSMRAATMMKSMALGSLEIGRGG